MPQKRPGALPTVVLVGRPNVGKSTLFNRVTDSRRAIVTPIAGTTRDTIAQPAEWQGVPFSLVDTGGMFGASTDPLHALVVDHGRKAIASADLIVFVVDGREGWFPGTKRLRARCDGAGAPVIMAVNKTDDRRARGRAVEFYSLGFEPVDRDGRRAWRPASAICSTRSSRRLPAGPSRWPAPAKPSSKRSVAIIGRPNVGKSSLLNRLLREERSIVSEMPGTTRDTVDALLRWHRRASGSSTRLASAGRAGWLAPVRSKPSACIVARRAIEKADVAVLVIDATEGATDQDADHCRRSRQSRRRRDRRRQQMGPDEGAGTGIRQGVRRASCSGS